jgi:hypothetical protein
MDNLIIKATPKSFDITCGEGLIEIRGCSILNNPNVFFKPILNWIDNYLKDPPDETIINMKIDYVDSATIKILFEILRSFEIVIEKKKTILVNWYYDPLDPEMLELGEILGGRMKIHFNFIKYQIDQ